VTDIIILLSRNLKRRALLLPFAEGLTSLQSAIVPLAALSQRVLLRDFQNAALPPPDEETQSNSCVDRTRPTPASLGSTRDERAEQPAVMSHVPEQLHHRTRCARADR
jgi:hypothetical protein